MPSVSLSSKPKKPLTNAQKSTLLKYSGESEDGGYYMSAGEFGEDCTAGTWDEEVYVERQKLNG